MSSISQSKFSSFQMAHHEVANQIPHSVAGTNPNGLLVTRPAILNSINVRAKFVWTHYYEVPLSNLIIANLSLSMFCPSEGLDSFLDLIDRS